MGCCSVKKRQDRISPSCYEQREDTTKYRINDFQDEESRQQIKNDECTTLHLTKELDAKNKSLRQKNSMLVSQCDKPVIVENKDEKLAVEDKFFEKKLSFEGKRNKIIDSDQDY